MIPAAVCFFALGCLATLFAGFYYATIQLHNLVTRFGVAQMDKIEKQIEINAPVERVWQALTDYKEFGQWFQGQFAKSVRCRTNDEGKYHVSRV